MCNWINQGIDLPLSVDSGPPLKPYLGKEIKIRKKNIWVRKFLNMFPKSNPIAYLTKLNSFRLILKFIYLINLNILNRW